MNDDLLDILIPKHWPPDLRNEIKDDVIVLALAGKLRELSAVVRKLRTRYADSRLSLDQPVGRDAAVLSDFVSRAGLLPKRRGRRPGRPLVCLPQKRVCEHCRQIFYVKYITKRVGRFCSRVCFLSSGVARTARRYVTEIEHEVLALKAAR